MLLNRKCIVGQCFMHTAPRPEVGAERWKGECSQSAGACGRCRHLRHRAHHALRL